MDSELKLVIARLTDARRMLAHPANMVGEEWLWLATIVVEAQEFREAAGLPLPMLDEVLAELREETRDFTDPKFLQSTGPARRDNPGLFQPGRR